MSSRRSNCDHCGRWFTYSDVEDSSGARVCGGNCGVPFCSSACLVAAHSSYHTPTFCTAVTHLSSPLPDLPDPPMPHPTPNDEKCGALKRIVERAVESGGGVSDGSGSLLAGHLLCAAKLLATIQVRAAVEWQERKNAVSEAAASMGAYGGEDVSADVAVAAAVKAVVGHWDRPLWTRCMHASRTGNIPDDDDVMFHELLRPAYFAGGLQWALNILRMEVFTDPRNAASRPCLEGQVETYDSFMSMCLNQDGSFFDGLMGIFLTNNQSVRIVDESGGVNGSVESGKVMVGTALYACYAMMNHSCEPSIRNEPHTVVIGQGLGGESSDSGGAGGAIERVEVVGVKVSAGVDIAEGSEICNFYIGTHQPAGKSEDDPIAAAAKARRRRRAELKQYLFTCRCSLCGEESDDSDGSDDSEDDRDDE